ncbi:SDR family oxidoreductase [Saccharopolyspora erythraea]|uniref:SDR family oxidoreductase n=1 Tax=Saccharopolyspora erythraea TaxID=1836 RepID=UPI001BA8C5E4|nr:SDR family oxidoreductase [Saccharopolyspora erythraea]QUH01638.1 SDR family oxidoreductase [Saccharopolyspora erythraea]
MNPFAGKKAIVAGGSRGIGRAVVRRLTAGGADVVFSYATDDAAAHELTAELTGLGAKIWAVRADSGSPEQVEHLFTEADAHLGGLDVLVGNAGITSASPLAEVTAAEYDRVMAVNARGAFLAIQHAARRMGEGGRIVNITSMSTAYATPGESVYAASKAAVEQFTRVAAKELAPRGITVNAVAPGPTDTGLLRGAVPAEALEATAAMIPLGRLGEPADIADVVALLAGPDSHWVTGHTVLATGGLV